MTMKYCLIFLFFSAMVGFQGPAYSKEVLSGNINNSAADTGKKAEDVLDEMEKRYSATAFSANFFQESTLKAMDITDTARGTVKVKRPGMMRWEYRSPDPQIIVTDGDKLWIYRPEDRQVMVGEAPSFFRDGRGAGFLSDMKVLRNRFRVSLDNTKNAGDDSYCLRLYPEDQSLDIEVIFLMVDSKTYLIETILTYSPYGDETRIELTDYDFDARFEDDTFYFSIPEEADVLEME